MPDDSGHGRYDDRLERHLAVLRADFPRGTGSDFRLSLVRELRENTSLTLSAAREQAEAFLRRKGYEIPPELPAAVLLAIVMLGLMAAVFEAPVFTLAVAGLLLTSGHSELASRCWPALVLASGACVCALATAACGPRLWRNYRRSTAASGSGQ